MNPQRAKNLHLGVVIIKTVVVFAVKHNVISTAPSSNQICISIPTYIARFWTFVHYGTHRMNVNKRSSFNFGMKNR